MTQQNLDMVCTRWLKISDVIVKRCKLKFSKQNIGTSFVNAVVIYENEAGVIFAKCDHGGSRLQYGMIMIYNPTNNKTVKVTDNFLRTVVNISEAINSLMK